MPDGPLTAARDGLRIAVRLSPRARADRLAAAAGGVIRAAVTAPPEDGRANEALLRLLARAWRVPRRNLSIVSGAASRNKVVRIAGNPQQLAEKLAGAIPDLPADG